MFDMPAEAKQVIEERFAPDFAEMVAAQLRPVIVFSAKDGDAVANSGGSRIGGAPDLPASLEWPRRPVPDDLEEIARRGGDESYEEMRKHLQGGMPYAFFAQVDLKAAAGLGDAAKSLPGEGRLLFFYDLIAGPYDNGIQSAKVIWDRSPASEVKAASVPKDLTEAAVVYNRMLDEIEAEYGRNTMPAEPGAPPSATPYGAAAREMDLKTALQLPAFSSLEFQASGKLLEAYNADRNDIGGEQALSEGYSELSEEYAPRTQLLGAPVPVQDDPRYNAVIVHDFNVEHLSGEDWQKNRETILEKAKDWTLLMQVEVAEWMQDSAEGTVYFLIREEDLKARAFDKVVAIYQQT